MAKYRALVVEDSMLLVGLLEQILSDIDVEIVGPAGTEHDALRLAKAESFHFAILDINLHGALVFSVADVLSERRIPFLFSSGYVVKDVLPPRYAKADVIGKPFNMPRLMSLLRATIAKVESSSSSGSDSK